MKISKTRLRNTSRQYDSELRHLYFAYGSNTHLEQMRHRCPDAVNLGPATLPGFRLSFRGHADVELDRRYDVQGLLWQINDYDLEGLDIYEGFPSYYLRQRVFVYNNYDEEQVAWVYTMARQDFESAPSKGYYDVCMEGYLENGLETIQLTEAADRVSYNDSHQEFNTWRKVYSV